MRATGISAVVITLVLAACGGSSNLEPGDDEDAGSAGVPSAAAPATGGGAGADDAPITVGVAGAVYGFDIGTCDVSDDVVSASAGRSDGSFSSVDVQWSKDGALASFRVADGGTAGPPSPFELVADASRADTTWDVAVDGTTAVIEARMRNDLPAAQGDPATEAYDVTIRIRCDERGFGGMAPAPTDGPLPSSEGGVPTTASESRITLEFGDGTSEFSYLGCPMSEPAIAFVVVEPTTFIRLFVGNGEAGVALSDGSQFQAQDVTFSGTAQSTTWSGTMSGPSGSEPATISISC